MRFPTVSIKRTVMHSLVLLTMATACTGVWAQKKVLVLGDTADITRPPSSSAYFNAAVAQMEVAVGAANVQKIGGLDATPLTAASLRQTNGDPYDIIVVTAVFGGVTVGNRTLIQQAIQNRTASAFFLFPDQCTSCAPNVDQITVPFVNAATGWGITRGTTENATRAVFLNNNTPLKTSFVGLPSLYVNDYTDLYNVPADNALYMRSGAAQPPAGTTRVNRVAATIVPRSQSYAGNGACIFVISDVNTLIDGNGNAVNAGLGTALVNASAQSCAVDEGGIAITKQLTLPTGVPGPFDFKFEATCDKPAANTVYPSPTLSYPTATSVVIPYIPAGANCTVKEVLPANPANYLWVAPADQTVAPITKDANQPVTFTNVLQPLPGSIHITKQLALPAGVAGPFDLTFAARCDGISAAFGPVTMSYPTQTTAEIPNVPANAQCRVVEAVPAPPTGYSWAPVPAVDVVIPVNAAAPAAFTNSLNAVPLGTLRVTHALYAPPSLTGTLPIAITASCTLASATTTYGPLTLNAPTDTFVDIASIPEGSVCAVSQSLPTAPTGMEWGVSVTAPTSISIVASTGASVAITNILKSLPSTGQAQPVPVGGLLWLLGSGLALALAGGLGIRRQRATAAVDA